MRILIAPHEIAGYYSNLARGFRKSSVCADFICKQEHPFGYRIEGGVGRASWFNHLFASWWRKAREISGSSDRDEIARHYAKYRDLEFRLFEWAISHYDVFIFGYGLSLLPDNKDLPILKWLNKMVILNLGHGSEMRPFYMDGALYDEAGKFYYSNAEMREAVKNRIEKMRFFESNSTWVVGAPYTSSQFATRSQINWFALGIPVDPSKLSSVQVGRPIGGGGKRSKTLRVLHCPSSRPAKGTREIEMAVNALQGEGCGVELQQISGRPNSEVIEAIRGCDFVVDQIYSDTPMAGFASEAALYGKACIVGGYGLRTLCSRWIPSGMAPTSYCCEPDEIKDAIKLLCQSPETRNEVANRSREFVTAAWTDRSVANRYLAMIEGPPSEWIYDPLEVNYVDGGGMSRNRLQALVASFVGECGVDALGLSHNPSLRRRLLESCGLSLPKDNDN